MSDIAELKNCPEISFIENMSLSETEEQLRALYKKFYCDISGSEPEISEADPVNLMIKAFCAMEYQTMQYIDAMGRQQFLKTTTGDALDALAALVGMTRKAAERATAMVRFTLSQERDRVTAIDAGIRVKTEDGKYFSTIEYTEIAAGEKYADILAEAQEAGADSSGISAGEINILVDPIPYIESVENISQSVGGLGIEDDESLTRRIYLAPSVYSSAGPRDAYEYHVKNWRSDVCDAKIESPEPDKVNVCFVIEENGEIRLPNDTELGEMTEHLSAEDVRPLCDKVTCIAPTEKEYEIAFEYRIARSNQKSAGEIQSRVETAVSEYKLWQRKLGRDISPLELLGRLRDAGVKRVNLRLPADIVIGETVLPKCVNESIVYGGLEDD